MVLIRLLSLSVSSAQEVLSKFLVVLETYRSAFVCLPVCLLALERCNPWPHGANRHISISDDVIRVFCAYSAHSPHSHCDVILIMTLRAYGARSPRSHSLLSWPRPLLWTYDVRMLHTDTLPCLIYRDDFSGSFQWIFMIISYGVCIVSGNSCTDIEDTFSHIGHSAQLLTFLT